MAGGADTAGGRGAANSGVDGNDELADASGSKDGPRPLLLGGGVGLGVVTGVVAFEGRGLEEKSSN